MSPNFWTDLSNGIPYYIAVQTPESQVHSLNDLGNTPVSAGTSPPATQPVPGAVGTVGRSSQGAMPVSTGTAPPTTEPVPGELSNSATDTRDSAPGSANQANI